MTDNSTTVESLRQELERLETAATNIRRVIRNLEREENQAQAQPNIQSHHSAVDRDGTPIHVGDRVAFLTKGRFASTHGIITRFSKRNQRVFAEDSNGNEIPRAPRNVRFSVLQHVVE